MNTLSLESKSPMIEMPIENAAFSDLIAVASGWWIPVRLNFCISCRTMLAIEGKRNKAVYGGRKKCGHVRC